MNKETGRITRANGERFRKEKEGGILKRGVCAGMGIERRSPSNPRANRSSVRKVSSFRPRGL